MSIKIKTAEEIEKMRVAGKLAASVLEMIEPHVKPGVTTEELDRICHDYILENNAYPAPLDYHGFPKSICTSINHIVCHGIPASVDEVGSTGKGKPAILKDGDVINIDITVIVPDDKDTDLSVRPKGYHGDSSRMFYVGEVSPADKRLCTVTQEALYVAMRKVKPGATVGDLGTAIDKFIKDNNKKNPRMKYSIVKDFCGHGIGSEFHEEPQVVHYKNTDNRKLKEGMCFTIEPMINAGKFGCSVDSEDDWTVYTGDGKNSAQWEHTILVTKTGCEVLTLRSDDTIPRIMKNV
ncbi:MULTISPECIES: type I methionyl aminopeptidase [Vibrio]|uniref:Methionine aminopeptidase n=1 Tax=Vibrio nigripulchritudo SOn1 TaxID=1238450 RepID=A0AAV2VXL3_9VIBR|nr:MULTISPECIES: type I methionyl aminopeptidase [Vibrio]KJY69035.1 methionine aminopeptidase [Vibrio nigripulchritudo]UAB69468.1 type I methionyl aminopeptidase [Vibrio sp. SCSIO 43132]CCN70033.1 methionine aminopeptidase [Vibrio nigripulchritudo SFn118]CCO49399.1 methionine aminopeptidase [Vibrio nigripulchritudo SOn1]BCL68968.1 methionine aminopeptidase [Vibrio nigripulchritudo]